MTKSYSRFSIRMADETNLQRLEATNYGLFHLPAILREFEVAVAACHSFALHFDSTYGYIQLSSWLSQGQYWHFVHCQIGASTSLKGRNTIYIWLCMHARLCKAMYGYVCMALSAWLCMYGYVSNVGLKIADSALKC